MIVKICGITRREDALAAVEAGAGMIGFIFVPGSKRFIRPVDVRAITAALPPDLRTVGVFVDTPRETILDFIGRSGVNTIQLHGDEAPEETEGYPVPVIKAHRVSASFDPAVLARYRVEAHLLDAYVEGRHGGTGVRFDHGIARRARGNGRIILGGGLTPENVADAIRTALPDGVDVSSGVERAPGIKDHDAIRQFVDAARTAARTVPSLGKKGS